MYKIIKSTSAHVLAKLVNQCVVTGYRPVGGVAWDGHEFLQALFREKNDAND